MRMSSKLPWVFNLSTTLDRLGVMLDFHRIKIVSLAAKVTCITIVLSCIGYKSMFKPKTAIAGVGEVITHPWGKL